MSNSLYATLPHTSQTSFVREMTALQSEVNTHEGHVTSQEMHSSLYCCCRVWLQQQICINPLQKLIATSSSCEDKQQI